MIDAPAGPDLFAVPPGTFKWTHTFPPGLRGGTSGLNRSQLVLRAHVGHRFACRLEHLQATWLDEGAEILTIGDERGKELQAAIAQHDIDSYRVQHGKPVVIRIIGETPIESRLVCLTPRTELQFPDAAMGAPTGSPREGDECRRQRDLRTTGTTLHRLRTDAGRK